MNNDTLHRLIDIYEERFYELNDSIHDEIFKWRAAKRFRDVWFSERSKQMPFSEMFNEAKKDFLILMDNSFVCPSSGVVKIAEKDQEAVANLFNNVLFANDGGDIKKRQENIDRFLQEFDLLRSKYYPQSFKFKQDRHSASCYLAFYAPEDNYIYRYSEAEMFSQYIEFGKDIGSGQYFRLDYYYEMCDLIVEALKEHVSLLEKHFAFLNDNCFRDESLHLLAFDVMYCSRAYNFYLGMEHTSKKQSLKAFTEEQAKEKERLEKEAKIGEIKKELFELENKAEEYETISLINIEANHHKYGKGVVVFQERNQVVIRFESGEKTYVIHEQYAGRPTFEDDENVIRAMTDYGDICERIEDLKEQLARIQ